VGRIERKKSAAIKRYVKKPRSEALRKKRRFD
jgi:hypothetical protein